MKNFRNSTNFKSNFKLEEFGTDIYLYSEDLWDTWIKSPHTLNSSKITALTFFNSVFSSLKFLLDKYSYIPQEYYSQ